MSILSIFLLFLFFIGTLLFLYKLDPQPKKKIIVFCFLVLGALSTILSLFITFPLQFIIPENSVILIFISCMIATALAEESCKYFVSYMIGKACGYFESRYSTILAMALTALGFGTLENFLFYSGSPNLLTAFARAFFGGPLHVCAGVMMGYFYSVAHQNKENKKVYFTNLAYSICLPVLFHGLINFASETIDNPGMTLLQFFLRLFFSIYLIIKVRNIAKVEKGELDEKKGTMSGLKILISLLSLLIICFIFLFIF